MWIEVRAYPLGERTAFYALDISARKKIETDLAEAQKKLTEHAANLERAVAERTASLEETVAELERFSYTISHDLRAPLRTLESFSQFVMEDYADKLDQPGHDYLRRIRDAARRMDALISDVLLYSRISRGELRFEAVDLDILTRNIVSQYSSLNLANISVQSPLGTVHGNETMLTQTLSNLLQNAVKFVKPGEKPSIKVWSEPQEQHLRIFVQDKGIGIPPEGHAKIFNIFQRAHAGSYEGTGVGLAIVQRAVERMHGTIGFSSNGDGTTFWVELPKA
jgi:signal transduction histidine kinase